jgi:uncharacterized protein with HEPN domain
VKDDRFYLIHVLERIQRIESYTTGGREAFLASSMIQDAVIRNFEIIGEAAKQVSESFRLLHPGLPWRRLAGFRDVLIHNYPGVDRTRSGPPGYAVRRRSLVNPSYQRTTAEAKSVYTWRPESGSASNRS